MVIVTGIDLQEVCSSDNLCVGIKAGIEGGVHAMRQVLDDDETEGLLLLDASNAFNSLNREAALWNCRVLWPRCSRFLFNTYRGYARIFVAGTEQILLSKEGTTQGDPLAMLMYGAGLLPLTLNVKKPKERVQNLYADDSACGGKLIAIRDWLIEVIFHGPKSGYFPEPSKSFLIVKEGKEDQAKELFEEFGVEIVQSKKFLGGCLGESNEVKKFVKEKVDNWVNCVHNLAKVAEKYPQSAYVSFSKSLQCEWIYMQRVVPTSEDDFIGLRNAIQKVLMPAILGREVLQSEYELLELPVRWGGMAFRNP